MKAAGEALCRLSALSLLAAQERQIDFRHLYARMPHVVAQSINSHAAAQRLDGEQVAQVVESEVGELAPSPRLLRARQETTESGARWGIPKFGIVSYARACSMLL